MSFYYLCLRRDLIDRFTSFCTLLILVITKGCTLERRHGSWQTMLGTILIVGFDQIFMAPTYQVRVFTAVGVTSKTIDLNTGKNILNLLLYKLDRGYNMRVDVVSSWTETLAIPDLVEYTKCVVIIAGVLDRVYISVHAVNCLHTTSNFQ